MKITAPLYEGDSFLRYGAPAGGAAEAPAHEAVNLLHRSTPDDITGLDAWRIEQRARSLRSAYVWNLMAGLADRIDGWFDRARRREAEGFLAKAQDHADLERRIRVLERTGSIG